MATHNVDQRTRNLQQPATEIILRTHTEPSHDLRQERQKATFNVEELAYVLNNGKELLEKK
jgi:acyl-CoA oxidase